MGLGLQYVGSFQDYAQRAESENPLEEVWSQVSRFATNECLKALVSDTGTPNWDAHLAYVKVRIHQSIEFRRAAYGSTLLTAPLPLYYSFLNLMRAQMALVPEVMPIPLHGLSFKDNADLLSCEAAFCEGTFTQYLNLQNIPWEKGCRISLRDALGCIPEMHADVCSFDSNMSHAQVVIIDARTSPYVGLKFIEYPKHFAANWQSDFPNLTDTCSLEADKVLLVQPAAYGGALGGIAPYLHQHLYNHLTLTQTALWWALRRSESFLKLDRIGYYHVAAFILGNAVRYQPELIFSASGADSGLGWLLNRFRTRAERFYPQLQLMWDQKGSKCISDALKLTVASHRMSNFQGEFPRAL
jgi:YaaC-like Protein